MCRRAPTVTDPAFIRLLTDRKSIAANRDGFNPDSRIGELTGWPVRSLGVPRAYDPANFRGRRSLQRFDAPVLEAVDLAAE
ncbi:MAG: hypothetical protein ACRENE_31410 [Polyangiaceae bacterium]